MFYERPKLTVLIVFVLAFLTFVNMLGAVTAELMVGFYVGILTFIFYDLVEAYYKWK